MPGNYPRQTDLGHDNSSQAAHNTSNQGFRPKDKLPSAVVNSYKLVEIQLGMDIRSREEDL
jgi:hypothetical protein